ncbi:hypothetical protein L0152_16735 [bacterium]|nr:hypothetical protein [bacterium]
MIRVKHIKIFCILIFCSIIAMSVYGQITWSKMYGGHDLDEAFCGIATSTQSFVVAGRTSSFASEDLWVINVDSAGNIIWQKTYSGAGPGVANSIIKTSDGFVLVGYILSAAGDKDLWVLKLDQSGNVIWQRSIGTATDDEGFSIMQSVGYVVAGKTGSPSDAWIINLDQNGNVVWQKSYGSLSDDIAFSVIRYLTTGYIFVGSYNGQNLWVVNLDFNGDIVWQKTFVSQSNSGGFAKSIIPTSGAGFLIAGAKDTSNLGRLFDAWALKLDFLGNLQWERIFGTASSDWAESAVKTTDGSLIVAGITDRLMAGEWQPWIMKLNPQGIVLWQKFYPVGTLRSVQATIDGGIQFAGLGRPDMKFWAVKADANGDLPADCDLVTPGDFDFVNLNSVASDTSATSQNTIANDLDTSAIAVDTAAFELSKCATDCLFCDEFEDGILNLSWTYQSEFWNENGGELIGNPRSRALAVASPVFAGCSSCSIETGLQANGDGKLIFLSWFQDKKNTLELVMDEAKDKWVFKRKLNGKIVNKLKAKRVIDPNQSYAVVMMFDGNSWRVFINSEFLFEIFNTFGGTPSGTIGLKVRSMTGSMQYIHVN